MHEEHGGALERVIEALRGEVPIRAEWRGALAGALRDAPVPVRLLRRGWHVTPVMATAAALLFMVFGAGATLLMQRGARARGNDASHAAAIRPDGAAATLAAVTASTVGVRFAVMAPGVKRVSLVGDFNRWDADATPLHIGRDGQTWTTVLPLTAGRHAYAFVIDGEVVRDPTAPAAPDANFGVTNSMVLVSHLQ